MTIGGQTEAEPAPSSKSEALSEQTRGRSLLPVRWDPALSRHQGDVTQLPGPQVALHLAEGGVSVGQCGEHALLWARARLHGHAGGQRGAAVGRPVPHGGGEDTDKRRRTQRLRVRRDDTDPHSVSVTVAKQKQHFWKFRRSTTAICRRFY